MLDWRRPISETPIGTFDWCGFTISSNIPLPRLRASRNEAPLGHVEFIWRPGAPPMDEPPMRSWTLPTWDGRTFDVAIGRDESRLVYETSDSGRYVVRLDHSTIEFYGTPSSDPMMVEHALVHSVLGIWGGLNGFLCLHASAVARDGKAVLFVGPTGFGKSTRAWRLLVEGWSFVTDDVAVVSESNDEWFVYPGPRTLRIPGLEVEEGWITRGKKEVPVEASLERAKVDEVRLLGRLKAGTSVAAGIPSLLKSHPSWRWASREVRRTLLKSAAGLVTATFRISDHEPPSVPPRESVFGSVTAPVSSQTEPSSSSDGAS